MGALEAWLRSVRWSANWPKHGLVVQALAHHAWRAPAPVAAPPAGLDLHSTDDSLEASLWHWVEYESGAADGAARVVARGASRLADLPPGRAIVLLLAAPDVVLGHARVPPLSGQRLRSALPYLVEERVLSEPRHLHVALDAEQGRANGGERALAWVERAWLQGLLARFAGAGHEVALVLPESLCAPLAPDAWTLVHSPDRGTWVRSAWAAAMSLPDDPAALRSMLSWLLERTPRDARPVRIDVYGELPGFDALLVDDSTHAGRADLAADGVGTVAPVASATTIPLRVAGEDALAAWLAQGGGAVGGNGSAGASAALPVNLLQHEFVGVGRASWKTWRTWRVAALLALVLVSVQLAAMQIHWAQLRAERSALQNHMADTVRSVFPETTVILDAQRQMEQGLARLSGAGSASETSGFAALAVSTGQVFAGLPPGAARRLVYAQGSLRLELAASAAGDAEQRAQWIRRAEQQGLTLRFTDDAGVVRAELRAELRPDVPVRGAS